MAGSLLVDSLLLMTAVTAIYAVPRRYPAFPVMACGNMLSRNNENLCRNFKGGGLCTWNPTSNPKCRVGRDVRTADPLLDRSLTQLQMPLKPYNAFTVITAAKTFAVKTGQMQMKHRAEEHERWLRYGKRAFDKSESPQCLINVPLCHRVKCGAYSSQTSATQCLSDPRCCFDRSLYQYQYAFGSEFMGGAPTCYYGASSAIFREVTALVKPWNPWYSAVLFDLFKEELMKPISHSGLSACSVVDPMKNTCGWEGISESECRLKDCCYTRHNTCVYPQNAVVERLKILGSYPELNTDVAEEAQCMANPFVTPSVYRRIPCQRLSSDPYSVLSCSAECCMDRTSIPATLRTNGFLTNPQPRVTASHATSTRDHQQNRFIPYGARQPNIPQMASHQPHNSNNPWGGLPHVTPDLVKMVSTIMKTDSKSSKSKPTVGGDPTMNLMMQMMSGSPNNPPMPMSAAGSPSGLSGGLLEFYLKNGGRASVSSGQRSLKPGGNTMMDAYVAGLLGAHNSQLGKSLNPNMLYFLLNSKKNGKGLDINTMLHLGILPFGKPTQGGHATNPYIISSLLGDESSDMSDAMKFALMQGLGNGGDNMATAMLMSNLMKEGESKDKSEEEKFLMMNLLSNLMNRKGSNRYQSSPYANSNRRSYQKHQSQVPPQQQHFNMPYHTPRVNPHHRYPQTKYSNSDMALVDGVLSKHADGITLPYCPYNFIRIGRFPDISHSVRGCCKVSACYRTKKINTPAPVQKPVYGPWTAWTPCDKTCGAAAYRSRVRTCSNIHTQSNARCDEPTRQFDKCVLGPCQLTGESQHNDLIAGPRKVIATDISKPETRKDLNNRMERLLHQLDNPLAAPDHRNSVSTSNGNSPTAPSNPTIPSTVAIHSSQSPPMRHPPQVLGTKQNGEQPLKWRIPDQKATVEKHDTYGPWSTWSICDRGCGVGRKIRMRLCSSSIRNCGNSTEETAICNTHSCGDATDIGVNQINVSATTVTPAPSTMHGLISSAPVTPVNIPSLPEKEPPISQSLKTRFVYGSWSPWSSCQSSSPICTGDGIRTRERNCFTYMDDDITPIPRKNCKDSVQIDPCVVPCGAQNLPESTTATTTVGSSERPLLSSPGSGGEEDVNIPIDGNWSTWSKCEGSCGENQGFSKRQRKCVTAINDPFCDTEGLILKAKKSCTVQC